MATNTRLLVYITASGRLETIGQRTHRNLSQIGSRGLKTASSADIEAILSTPTWSVASLLPKDEASDVPTVTPKQLRHLLRLSALPPPKDEVEEQKMLKTLSSQLHFVKDIQSVDTTGIEPLRSLRDETAAGRKEATISLDTLKDAFAQEDTIGEYHKRIRRRRDHSTSEHDKWEVLGNAAKKAGRFFVVEGGKD